MTQTEVQPYPPPILHLPNSHCLVRPFAPTDEEAASMAKEANNSLIAQWMTNAFPHPYTPASATNWITFANSQSPVRDFAICHADTNILIGAIGLKLRSDVQYRTLEVGYWLGQAHWGRGIASEVLRAFAKWAFEHFDHVVRLEAEVFEGNQASGRVLEKAGFVLEGRRRWAIEKGGVLKDALVYCLLKDIS